MRIPRNGFTLVELMIVVAIVGILAAIGIANYGNSVRKSGEALTKGNMGTIRSALGIYYSDNDGVYPSDNLSSITANTRYLAVIPVTRTQPNHPDMSAVATETTVTDSGEWSYNNVDGNPSWGAVHVGCLHQDARGQSWSTY